MGKKKMKRLKLSPTLQTRNYRQNHRKSLNENRAIITTARGSNTKKINSRKGQKGN